MPPTNSALRLKYLRALTGLSRKDFCLNHNLSYSTMSLWENCAKNHGNNLSMSGAAMLTKLLKEYGINTSCNWLVNGDGLPPDNQIKANETATIIHSFKHDLAAQAVTYSIKNDDMQPRFPNGTLIAFKEVSPINLQDNSAYLTVDVNGVKRFSYVKRTKLEYFLYDNNPMNGSKTQIIAAFKPYLICH